MTILVELNEAGDRIRINAEWRYKDLCRTLPGATWSAKESVWTMPVSWSGCLALRSTFRSDLEIGPKLSAWAFQELSNRIEPANLFRDAVELGIEGWEEDLFPHQRVGVKFLSTAEQAILADEPGLGKTCQAIRTLKAIQDKGDNPFPALVVCPNSLKLNWEREFGQWWPGVKVQVITGTATEKRKQFDTYLNPEEDVPQPDVFVVNWESLRSHSRLTSYGSIALKRCPGCGGEDPKIKATACEVHKRELNQIEFRAIIADEAHRMKDPKAKQTRALKGATGDAKYRYALTGTPIAHTVLDLWSILNWLAPEEWPSRSRWLDRMVNTMTNAFGGLMVLGVKPEMESEFFSALNPRMRRMLKAVVLPWLPPVMNIRKDVEMSPKQKKAYEQMRDFMIAELEDGEYLTAPNPLTQTGRLIQFANAYAELDVDPATGMTKALLSEPSNKVDALMEDIKNGDFGDDSVAVSAVSRQLIMLLSARLTKEKIPHGLVTGEVSGWERQKAVDDFQQGKTKFILFTAQAGGVGITLTKARWLVRLQRPWSLVDDKQVNDRVHRIGSEQHDSVILLDYVSTGTVEDKVREALDVKGENFEGIVKDKEQLLNLLKDDAFVPPKPKAKRAPRKAKTAAEPVEEAKTETQA